MLYRTKQAWKFWAVPMGILVSGALIVGAQWYKESIPDRWYLIALYSGILVGAFSIVCPAAAIRCPSCGSRWFWLAISRNDGATWYERLMTQSACSTCGYRGKALGR